MFLMSLTPVVPAQPGSRLIRRAAGQDEAGIGVMEIGEEAFAIRARVHPVELGNVAGGEDAALLADVRACLDHLGALGGTEVHGRRQRRINLDVVLRRFHQRHQLRVVRLAARQRLHRLDRALQGLIVELVRRRAGRLLAVAHGDRDFLVMFDEVGGDARVREAGRRSLAAREAHFHTVGLAHVQDLVGDLFDFVFRVSHSVRSSGHRAVRPSGSDYLSPWRRRSHHSAVTDNPRTEVSTTALAWDERRQRVTSLVAPHRSRWR